jgi:hypothetical protein
LWIVLLLGTPVQAVLAWDWIGKFGLVGGIIKWFESARLETIYAAAVIDFTALILILAIWYWIDSGNLKKQRPLLFWGLMSLIWFLPSLGISAYFLFFRSSEIGISPKAS